MDNKTFSMLHGINEIKIINNWTRSCKKKNKSKQTNNKKTSILLEKVIQFEQTTSISCWKIDKFMVIDRIYSS